MKHGVLAWTRPSRNTLLGLSVSFATLGLLAAVLIGVDLFLHTLFADRSGVNVQGYRGSLLGPKTPGELRIAVLGGSTAFGYRVRPNEAFPSMLQPLLAEELGRQVSVANLAYNNESAVCFAPTLEHYAYLTPDIVLLYSGYNDLTARVYARKPSDCYRERSLVFRATGYLPLLPEALRSLYYLARYGSVERGYQQEQGRVLFVPDWTEFHADESGDGSLSVSGGDPAALRRDRYVRLIQDVVSTQLSLGRGVIFVTQPYRDPDHREQQAALRAGLGASQDSPLFRYVNLGDTIDLRDEELSFDGMHLTAAGNARIAASLTAPIEGLARELVVQPSR